MTDKDSQLDEIERLAVMWLGSASNPALAEIKFGPKFNPALFLPGGLYYKMRRQLWDFEAHEKQTKEFTDLAIRSQEVMGNEFTRLRKENEQLRKQVEELERTCRNMVAARA